MPQSRVPERTLILAILTAALCVLVRDASVLYAQPSPLASALLRLDDLSGDWIYSERETAEAYEDIAAEGYCEADGIVYRPRHVAIAAYTRLDGDIILGHVLADFDGEEASAAFACLRDELLAIAAELAPQNGVRGVTVAPPPVDATPLGDETFSFRIVVRGDRADSTDLAAVMARRAATISLLVQLTDDPPPEGIEVETLIGLVPLVHDRIADVVINR